MTPHRRKSRTVASPTSGKNVSTRQVTNSWTVRMRLLYITAWTEDAFTKVCGSRAVARSWSKSLWYYFSAMNLFRARSNPSFVLPPRIQRLQELAYNLWWTWQPEATRLFGRLDYDLWESLGHNPILFLRKIEPQRLAQALEDPEYLALYDSVFASHDAYMQTEDLWARRVHPELTNRPIAYFSMEYGLHEMLPIYSGGLGILAADHLKESSDLGLPLVGVGLMYSEGYFTQRVSEAAMKSANSRRRAALAPNADNAACASARSSSARARARASPSMLT